MGILFCKDLNAFVMCDRVYLVIYIRIQNLRQTFT